MKKKSSCLLSINSQFTIMYFPHLSKSIQKKRHSNRVGCCWFFFIIGSDCAAHAVGVPLSACFNTTQELLCFNIDFCTQIVLPNFVRLFFDVTSSHYRIFLLRGFFFHYDQYPDKWLNRMLL